MNPARQAVIDILTEQARRFPKMPPISPALDRMDPRDARLAIAIHRTTLQRWLTLQYVLETKMAKRLAIVQPELQAILLSGAAQLLFMDKLPVHAVVDESVKLAKRRLRRGAANLTNAVLRRIAEAVIEHNADAPWTPAPDRLPWRGGYLRLADPLLPPAEPLDKHLSIATSHPVQLVRAWRQRFGDDQTIQLLLHNLSDAPTIVHTDGDSVDPALAEPHERPGFAVWRAEHARLVEYLSSAEARWVQDPTSAAPVAATADLRPQRIIDLCAGRGTKTRQLAHFHPDAAILATDPDAHRFAELQSVFEGHPRVRVVPFAQIHEHDGTCDLLLLDVPCSNTGVLARRLEARYRYRHDMLGSLVKLQRSILTDAAPLLQPDGGRLLYSTCSIEAAENDKQVDRAARQLNMTIARSELTLPGGAGSTYHDGGYYALLT